MHREKTESLRRRISALGRAAVAFSGGVDSALVLKVARERLGAENALGVMAVSPSLPESERAAARVVAGEIGVRLDEIETGETDDPRYRENTPRRCYFCKDVVYREVVGHARAEGFVNVLDGMNADDASDVRPGRVAARERGVMSPLSDCGMTKEEIRDAARELGLSNWAKPAAACLASRIPYGVEVTAAALAQVGGAEGALRELGFEEVRVRRHGDTARIEVPAAEIPRLAALGGEVVARLKGFGFTYVSADLEGFRSGSLNEALRPGTRP